MPGHRDAEGVVPALCEAPRARHRDVAPPEPRLLEPRDGQTLGRESLPDLDGPPRGGPMFAQVFEHHLGNTDEPTKLAAGQARALSRRAPRGKVNPFLGVSAPG